MQRAFVYLNIGARQFRILTAIATSIALIFAQRQDNIFSLKITLSLNIKRNGLLLAAHIPKPNFFCPTENTPTKIAFLMPMEPQGTQRFEAATSRTLLKQSAFEGKKSTCKGMQNAYSVIIFYGQVDLKTQKSELVVIHTK